VLLSPVPYCSFVLCADIAVTTYGTAVLYKVLSIKASVHKLLMRIDVRQRFDDFNFNNITDITAVRRH